MIEETNETAAEEGSAAAETTATAVLLLSAREPPRLKPSSAPWIFGTPLILLICLSAIAYFDMLHSPAILTATLLLAGIIFVLIWQLSSSWDQDVQDTIYLVQESRLELTALKDELTRYLQQVDQRASGHFDAISRNVTTYFNLIQIRNALEERLSIVSRLLKSATNSSLLSSYRCLQQPLQVTLPGVTPGTGEERDIPIGNVEQAVMDLVQQLETTLADLECDAAIAEEDLECPS